MLDLVVTQLIVESCERVVTTFGELYSQSKKNLKVKLMMTYMSRERCKLVYYRTEAFLARKSIDFKWFNKLIDEMSLQVFTCN